MTIASITCFDRVVKLEFADKIQLIPLVRTCLSHKGVDKVRAAGPVTLPSIDREPA